MAPVQHSRVKMHRMNVLGDRPIHLRSNNATATAGIQSIDKQIIPHNDNSDLQFTRICMKNLPANILSETNLRTQLAQLDPLGQSDACMTDCQILRTRNGQSRRMAFIGYATQKDAERALHTFRKTYIGTSRIEVEWARPISDKNKSQHNQHGMKEEDEHRPWSKYTPGSSAYEAAHAQEQRKKQMKQKQGEQKNVKKHEDSSTLDKFLQSLPEKQREKLRGDKMFHEYLAVHTRTGQFWANDDDGSEGKVNKRADDALVEKYETYVQQRKINAVSDAEASDEEEDDHADEEHFSNPAVVKDDNSEIGAETSAVARVSNNNIALDENISDAEYMKRITVDFDSNDDEEWNEAAPKNDMNLHKDASDIGQCSAGGKEIMNSDQSSTAAVVTCRSENDTSTLSISNSRVAEKNCLITKQVESSSSIIDTTELPPDVNKTGRLFIRNLPFAATEDSLQALLKPFGSIVEVHIPLDQSNRSKGFALVQFSSTLDAAHALEKLDGSTFQGRIIHVHAAHPKPGQSALSDLSDDQRAAMTYKKLRELKEKEDAHKSDNWNSLFIRQDTVVDAIASKLGVSKQQIMDPNASNLAVRVAVAETQLIDETKDWLMKHGVNVSVFQGSKKIERSTTTILVKNIPFDTKKEELIALFAKHGELISVLLPPSHTMALVEYVESVDAKRGFRQLAFKKFKHVPLYLEWAPVNSIDRQKVLSVANSSNDSISGAQVDDDAVELLDAAPVLFVKNLNFETREPDLRRLFERVGPVRALSIKMKLNPKANKNSSLEKRFLSLGYGFVEYKNKIYAERALQTLQGSLLDGHRLEIKVSNRTHANATENETSLSPEALEQAKNASTKLVYKNAPFQAAEREIRELFQAYGTIKSVRMPRKMNGQGRGFAFIEFVTKNEARSALERMQKVHFYGRPLVLEWAKDTGTAVNVDGVSLDVDALRKRTAEQFARHGDSAGIKRSRIAA